MRIVHITNAGGFGRTQRGGAERAVDELASELSTSFGWDEHVIAPPEFFANGSLGESVARHPVGLSEFSTLKARRHSGMIAQTLREIQPDVVMTHLLRGTMIGLPAAARNTKAKRVSVLHATLSDYEKQPGRNRFKGSLNRAAYRRVAGNLADLNIAISGVNRADLVEVDRLDPKSVVMIHNWVSPEFSASKRGGRSAVRAGIEVGPEAPLALVAGRLEREKNQSLAIELLADAPDLTLAIAGEGELRGELVALARRTGVEKRVRFVGHRTDIAELMAAADVVVVPSLFEAFGRVIVEALAVGTPVIASQIPAIEEVLEGAPAGAATTIPLDDRQAWADHLSDAAAGAADPEELAAFAAHRYSLHAAATRYDCALRSLVDGTSADQATFDALPGAPR